MTQHNEFDAIFISNSFTIEQPGNLETFFLVAAGLSKECPLVNTTSEPLTLLIRFWMLPGQLIYTA